MCSPSGSTAGLYSGRAGIDHDASVLVDKKSIRFPIKAELHEFQVLMDDQEYATADTDADFHCNYYDGPPAFVDAVTFHVTPEGTCQDLRPPVPVCPATSRSGATGRTASRRATPRCKRSWLA